MAKAKRDRRSGEPVRHRPPAGDEPWKSAEDDPLRDLRPEDDDDLVDPAADEYVWPDLTDENEMDD